MGVEDLLHEERRFTIFSVDTFLQVLSWISQRDHKPEIAGDRRKPAPSLQRYSSKSALARGLAPISYTTM